MPLKKPVVKQPIRYRLLTLQAGRRHPSLLLSIGAVLASCIYDPGAKSDRIDENVTIESVEILQSDSLRPRIQLRLDHYLDPALSNPDQAVDLRTGGARAFGRASYSPSERAITFTPASDLIAGATYTLTVDASMIRGFDGRAAEVPEPLQFDAGASPREPESQDEALTFSAIAPIFEARCNECHREYAEGGLTDLTPSQLVFEPSAHVDGALLVVPFEPASSLLMQKVLPEHPLRAGATMPPPWGGVAPLDRVELEMLEAWIAHGALE